MRTKFTVKGQVTLPKESREAASLLPGQYVSIRHRAEGDVIVESVNTIDADDKYLRTLQEIMRRRPITKYTTEEIMEISRGEG